jgi:hypothetical protein
MPYLIQGDEFELGMDLMQRLGSVIAEESEALVLGDAMRRLRNSMGIVQFENRAEAERVAARFTEMGFANFIVDELARVPQMRLLGPGGELPQEEIGLVALGRLLLQEKQRVSDTRPRTVAISGLGIPLPGGFEETTVTRERIRYYLDLVTREHRWRVRSSALLRIVDVYTQVDVSRAYLNAGVRSLAREDRPIRAFSSEREWERYVTWLYQLKYG